MSINLKDIVRETAEVEEEFPGYSGFFVKIAYPGKAALTKITKDSTVQKLNRRTQSVEDELDQDKFLRKYVELVLKGWKGFKVSYLQEIALVEIGDLDPDQEVDFSIDNAVVLMDNSPAFDKWVTEVSTTLENFTTAS